MTLSGKIALVTGGTSGIGFHTASGLARRGATVYITGRSSTRGAEAQERIRLTGGHPNVHFIQADASTVGANQGLANRVAAISDRLDILVNNVGGTYNDRWLTSDGYEATLAMNFVGPFALTQALLPALERSGAGRIVNVASAAMAMWKGDPFVDPQAETRFLGGDAYARAKLLNVIWSFALARRLSGRRIVANALHPGLAWTSMTASTAPRSMPPLLRVAWPLVRWLQRRGSPVDGARTPIFLASAPEAAAITGLYFESDGQPANVPAAVLDHEMQERAWALAEGLVRAAPTATAVGVLS